MTNEAVLPEGRPFDAYAAEYDAALEQGLSATGEDKEYYARGRIARIREVVRELGLTPQSLMDFGCGTGSTTPLLLSAWNSCTLLGVDASLESIRLAQRAYSSARSCFKVVSTSSFQEQVDLVYCNGVFHHIPPAQRAESLHFVRESLVPGGLFACCENNPWNPGTRYVMRRIPFDRDAIPISPPAARRMLQSAGFQVLRTDFLFFFPHVLSWLRRLEPSFRSLPLGGQYIVFARRPA